MNLDQGFSLQRMSLLFLAVGICFICFLMSNSDVLFTEECASPV